AIGVEEDDVDVPAVLGPEALVGVRVGALPIGAWGGRRDHPAAQREEPARAEGVEALGVIVACSMKLWRSTLTCRAGPLCPGLVFGPSLPYTLTLPVVESRMYRPLGLRQAMRTRLQFEPCLRM